MQPSNHSRRRIDVRGIVQGVGFRPFVFGLAKQFQLSGFVRNQSSGVTIEVEGTPANLNEFVSRLSAEAPPLARIESFAIATLPAQGGSEFAIIASETIDDASTPISPDIATCEECLAELASPKNRRYRYPFINCTNCGPRYTITRDVPYDRIRTTMAPFATCAVCEAEYHDPSNRRFHAEPNACPDCGPAVWFVDQRKRELFDKPCGPTNEAAIQSFHTCIANHGIVAVKGIGGFHLACAATSEPAILKLRERKGRVDKPFAIMVLDIESVKHLANVSDLEKQLLCSRERPIVLLGRRSDCPLPECIAPGIDRIGVMLPYSPLHALLVEHEPLVMTSGNLSEEPIVRTNEEAFERLGDLVDAFLLHGREIHVVADDSVSLVAGKCEVPIRRSRGYAPLPVTLREPVPSIFAVGGELKATFCMTKDDHAFLSPHIGDMSNLETLQAFERAAEHFQKLFRITPTHIACDMHPGYLSSQWAREFAISKGLPLLEVQHHHAHIASVLAERKLPFDREVIGVSFDGTGYGLDGAIWGGEFLIASCQQFERWAHLNDIPLPGGDASIRHPFRAALAHLWASGIHWDECLLCVSGCGKDELKLLRKQLERNLNCVPTSSVGRLFDAVASITGIRHSVSYEAQAAMEMEALASNVDEAHCYPWHMSETCPRVINTKPLLQAVVDDVLNSVPKTTIINRFHKMLVDLILTGCLDARHEKHIKEVVLSGGVFQNTTLLTATTVILRRAGFEVLTNRIVPPNDGGLSLGQAAIAAAQTKFQ